MNRRIGLAGAVAALVGVVIGVSIFLLPGELAASAGPAVVFSYGIASMVAMFSCVVAAQLGAILPTAGASYVLVTRLVSPTAGFVQVWMIISGVSVAIAMIALGFADFASVLLPGINRTLIAVGIIVLLALLNIVGVKATLFGQSAMVALMLLVLFAFVVAGFLRLDADYLMPVMPNGPGSVLAAAVPASFSFAGFMMIIDLGGETRNPGRNIPLALLISFILVWASYSAIAIVLVGVVPWQSLAAMDVPVADVARLIFPAWTAKLVVVTILAAAATTINALLLGYSRDVQAVGRARMLPALFGSISTRTEEPVAGVLLLATLALAAVFLGSSLLDYATVVVIALMASQCLIGIATIRLPSRMTAAYEDCGFRLRRKWLRFWGAGLSVASLAFLVIGLTAGAAVVTLTLVITAAGAAVYGWRVYVFRSRGKVLHSVVRNNVDRQIEEASGG